MIELELMTLYVKSISTLAVWNRESARLGAREKNLGIKQNMCTYLTYKPPYLGYDLDEVHEGEHARIIALGYKT